MVDGPFSERAGLQAERTDLSWVRTSLAFVTNGVLFLLRRELSSLNALHVAAIGGALIFAALTANMALRRRRMLACRPLPTALAAPVLIGLTAAGTLLFAVLVLTTIVIQA
ncbi:DUF202 domain-containing protein [Salinisphaera sp. USBA-960]|nr:DUF202 domain-containing protein [Salifodinibacter halophilus]NNC26399.1 DUF202 domain-containing protein [Salifodinibacter halophilus]